MPIKNYFDTIHECDSRTDIPTDDDDDSRYAYCRAVIINDLNLANENYFVLF